MPNVSAHPLVEVRGQTETSARPFWVQWLVSRTINGSNLWLGQLQASYLITEGILQRLTSFVKREALSHRPIWRLGHFELDIDLNGVYHLAECPNVAGHVMVRIGTRRVVEHR